MLITCRGCELYFDKDTTEIGTDVRPRIRKRVKGKWVWTKGKWTDEDWLCKTCLKPRRHSCYSSLPDTGQFRRSIRRVIGEQ